MASGALILCRVARIGRFALTVDLPNNLTGTVPITAISENLRQRLTQNLQEVDEIEGNEHTPHGHVFDIKRLFYVGQYLRASVTSTENEAKTREGVKARKRIELSLDPKKTNRGLSGKPIPVNSVVQASVLSAEDYGFVMELGLEDGNVKGFLPKQNIPPPFDFADVEIGMVFMCFVQAVSSKGQVLTLTADHSEAGNLAKGHILSEAPTVDSLLPGVAVTVLLTQIAESSMAGKIMGMLNVTADNVHSGAGPNGVDPSSQFSVGSTYQARVIFKMTESQNSTIGVSVLDHVLFLSGPILQENERKGTASPGIALSSIVDEAKVKHVESKLGLYLDLGKGETTGFAHASRINDRKLDFLSGSAGAYKVGTQHKARVLDFNSFDGLYLVSLQKSVLEKPYLRIEDIPVGAIVQAKVERLNFRSKGIEGLILKVDDGMVGLASELNLSDVQLQHPERKFKEGMTVSAKVLSVNPEKRRLRFTLKKSLLDSTLRLWTKVDDIKPDDTSQGTLIKLSPSGGVVEFFGGVRGFLPVSEMSDTFIQNPSNHFRLGQTVSVKALEVDADAKRLVVSSRLMSSTNAADEEAFQKLQVGQVVQGTVTEKSEEDLTVDLEGTSLRTTLPFVQLGDGPPSKASSWGKRFRVSQTLSDLVIIDIFSKRRSVVLTNKPSLIKAARAGKLITSFEGLVEGIIVDGFVNNITTNGVFVEFAARVTGLLPRSHVSKDRLELADFGLEKGQSLKSRVLSLEPENKRFCLTLKDSTELEGDIREVESQSKQSTPLDVLNPVSSDLKSTTDLTPGCKTRACITSIKDTQLNVLLAENIQGRIDASEVFMKWEDIKDRKRPLKGFRAKQEIDVRVLGIHDARNHRFLPISHRAGKVPVFELSAKLNSNASVSSLDQVQVGSQHIAYVNNILDSCLWVNISPNVRGRLERIDASDDVSLINRLESHFPIGSAVKVRVKNVDLEKGHLDLTAKSPSSSTETLSLETLSVGSILPARVTKSNERSVWAQLNPQVVGHVGLTELIDDYDLADPTKFSKNDVIRVCVVDKDIPNKKITLTTRPSKVLSSSLPVKDKFLTSASQLKVNEIVRGFIRNVADIGLFIALGPSLTAFVRVAELSDAYIKDWKSKFEIDQLVKGKIISVDETTKQVQMSLKESVVSNDYVPPKKFDDVHEGDVVTGKVRAIKDFGVFIVIDNSSNVSGLCHRSQIADGPVEDVTKLYSEGDAVKAKVLKVNNQKRQISFGLKAKYFTRTLDDESDEEAEDGDQEDSDSGMDVDDVEPNHRVVPLDMDVEDTDSSGHQNTKSLHSNGKESPSNLQDDEDVGAGLSAGGFDWTGALQPLARSSHSPSPLPSTPPSKFAKRRKTSPTIQPDLTATLDTYPPQAPSDFERLLLGASDDSTLWKQYMAYYMQLGEIDSARGIAERALRDIPVTRQAEKLDIWTAYLNLEEACGDDESLEAVFARACQYTDRYEIHDNLVDIYVKAGKLEVSPLQHHPRN